MSFPLHLARVVALIVVLLAGVGVAAAVPVLTAKARRRTVRGWFRAVVRATGVRLVADAEVLAPSGAGTLVTCNHVSWLDIPAVLAVEPVRVLAKSDVRQWPVIGLLAARGGTLFIDRRRLRRLPSTVGEIATALRGNDSVLVFPEGSTWCGRTHGRYYPATLQAAVDAGAPVRPLSLHYRLADGTPTTIAAFVGTDTLIAAVWRVTGARGVTMELRAEPVIEPAGRTRRELARLAAAGLARTPAPVGQPPLNPAAPAVRSVHAGHVHH